MTTAEQQAYEEFLAHYMQEAEHWREIAISMERRLVRAEAAMKTGKHEDALGEIESARQHYERMKAA